MKNVSDGIKSSAKFDGFPKLLEGMQIYGGDKIKSYEIFSTFVGRLALT